MGSHLPVLGPQNTEGRGGSSLEEGEVRVPTLRKRQLHLSETKPRALTLKVCRKSKRKEGKLAPNILEPGNEVRINGEFQ